MPELAEVEFNRKKWDAGLGAKVLAVALHGAKRIFRGSDAKEIARRLTSQKLLRSEARGKQMLFVFGGDNWLGLHLGMSGALRTEPAKFAPEKHDHLVLRQAKQALVFRDPRLFGRVKFHHGKETPPWWSSAPEIGSKEFTQRYVADFLQRHARAPIKAVILRQEGFPGVGNWMADEILWRAGDFAGAQSGVVQAWRNAAALRRATRFVSREALRVIGHDYSDPPKSWLIHERWSAKGVCPRHRTLFKRATIGGRTTAWCAQCQV